MNREEARNAGDLSAALLSKSAESSQVRMTPTMPQKTSISIVVVVFPFEFFRVGIGVEVGGVGGGI